MLTRLLVGAFGLAALGWSMLALASFQTTAPFDAQARRILAGESFKDDVLDPAVARLTVLPDDRVVASVRLRAAAILRLRQLESALDRADIVQIDPRIAALRAALDLSLRAEPADPFLWLVRCWLDNTENGLAPGNVAALALSYELGPLEGWISLKRNRLALSMFPQLDGATQGRVVAEFAEMVDARLIENAADNLAGPGWPIRERLIASTTDVDAASKVAFAKYLYGQGVNLPIPGVPTSGERPWR